MLAAASIPAANDAFKAQLKSKWAISDLGDVKYCLGIAVVRDPEHLSIYLSQTAPIDHIIEQFHQTDAYPVATPMEPRSHLRRPTPAEAPSAAEAEHLAATPYCALVGCLMYLSLGTRPDISYPVNKLSSFLDCYTTAHWMAAIRVVRYLKGTRLLMLRLGGRKPISLVGHTDTDYANDPDRRCSVMGYTFSLGSGSILWASRKQKVVTLSSAEAEYIGTSEAAKEACWLRMLVRGIGTTVDAPTQIFCDNNAAIILAGDQSFHAQTKHIDTRYHHIRDCVEKEKISTPRVSSFENVADTLTKALPTADFLRHRLALGLTDGVLA
jgi:hypothetical protein